MHREFFPESALSQLGHADPHHPHGSRHLDIKDAQCAENEDGRKI